MKTCNENKRYGTSYELKFISTIGEHAESIRCANLGKVGLLRNYISAAKKRAEWNNIDSAKCIDHAYKVLFEITGRA